MGSHQGDNTSYQERDTIRELLLQVIMVDRALNELSLVDAIDKPTPAPAACDVGEQGVRVFTCYSLCTLVQARFILIFLLVAVELRCIGLDTCLASFLVVGYAITMVWCHLSTLL